MRRRIDPEQGALLSMQFTDSQTGADIAAAKNGTTGIYEVVDGAGNAEVAKGVVSKVDGTLYVHLIDSYNHNTARAAANRRWCAMPIIGDSKPTGIGLFDAIDVNSSTAELFTAGNMIVGL